MPSCRPSVPTFRIYGANVESTRMKSILLDPREYVVGVKPSSANFSNKGSMSCISLTNSRNALLPDSSHVSFASNMSIGLNPSPLFVLMSSRRSSSILVLGSKERSPSLIILLICWEYDVLGPALEPLVWLTRYPDMTSHPSSLLPRISAHANRPHGSLPDRWMRPTCGPTTASIDPPG